MQEYANKLMHHGNTSCNLKEHTGTTVHTF